MYLEKLQMTSKQHENFHSNISFLEHLENLNKGCWNECKTGPCPFCGPTGLCCSRNIGIKGCNNEIGGDDFHRCAIPHLVMHGNICLIMDYYNFY